MDLSFLFSSSNISITRYPQEGLMVKQSLGEKKRPPVEEMNRSLIGKNGKEKNKKKQNSFAASPISICIAVWYRFYQIHTHMV
jgi:hypothetical protein